jgi:type III restriction enzyme
MTTFTTKDYQAGVLASIELFLKNCRSLATAAAAFGATTEALWQEHLGYRGLAGLPADMPYFCLRVPTGGGKTWLAAKSVALVNQHFLRTEHSLILWLVPSEAIRDQTLSALKNLTHPYHLALREAGAITVMDLDEAKSISRATLDTSTVVLVCTRQAFQVQDTESRKVYQNNGALMHHFEHLTREQRASLMQLQPGETVPYSLANVLWLRRPFVVVDEAHNNRTELAFEMLARFRPSGVMELTATPDMEKTPSNVLHSVSAVELKNEHMIKLPIVLQSERDWQQCLANGLGQRAALQALADAEMRDGATYLRPIVLIQAQPKSSTLETLHVGRVYQELVDNHRILPDEIVMATGDERGLEKLAADYPAGILDPACPVKFVITQKALAEGWDCPFAYVLVSMASLKSETSVEQLLGRILRQPYAKLRPSALLNQSYAFVVSDNFVETAHHLRESLVKGAGFERQAVADFIKAAHPAQVPMDWDGRSGQRVMTPVTVALDEMPKLKQLPVALRQKLEWNAANQTLTVKETLSEDDTAALQQTVSTALAINAIAEAALASRTTAIEVFMTPAELGAVFKVPQLALWAQGKLALFDDPEVLDFPWVLSVFNAAPTPDELNKLNAVLKAEQTGTIDISELSGNVFFAAVQRDLDWVYQPDHWDAVQVAAWICRNIPEPALTHESKRTFVAAWLGDLLVQPNYTLARANVQKFQIRQLIESAIRRLRVEAVMRAYQTTLFGEGRDERVAVCKEVTFEFQPQAYAPYKDYDQRFGHFNFKKHYYGRVGDFDSREEWECACQLDMWAQQGRISFWVRNLVYPKSSSFALQKANGAFHPDFLCQLPSGVLLAVEYKGADRWANAEDDRLIGGLWAELSSGLCRFVMVTRREWWAVEKELE